MRLANLVPISDGQSVLAFADEVGSFYPVAAAAAAAGITLESDLTDSTSHAWLTPSGLAQLADVHARLQETNVKPVDTTTWQVGPPVPKPGKIIAAGRNYMDHVREGQEIWAKRGKKIEIPTFPTGSFA